VSRDRRILVVEDDEKSRRLMCDVLAYHRFRPLAAESGEHALVLARENPPLAALVDIFLPGMNGYDVLVALRAQPGNAGMPVIAVTASAMEHDRVRMLASGFDACIVKPVNIRQLVDTLHALIEAP
jgi:two-component system, cell cycle response regulator DivK